jgi:RES domain-containing protein
MPLTPLPPDPCYVRLGSGDLDRLAVISVAGTWYRAIRLSHTSTALAVAHTSSIASRFNAGGAETRPFTLLYLGENHMVALMEVRALLGSPLHAPGLLPVPTLTWAILPVNVNLQRVVDLTEPTQTNVLDLSAQELTGDWEGYDLRRVMGSVPGPIGRAPTQQLGAELRHHRSSTHPDGFEGVLIPSAQVPYMKNLVIFPQNLQPTSTVDWKSPVTGVIEQVDRT